MRTFRTSDEKVAYYSKSVEISDTGMVAASVFAHAADNHCLRRTGLKFFNTTFTSLEYRTKKAHEWADKHMKLCLENECQYQTWIEK